MSSFPVESTETLKVQIFAVQKDLFPDSYAAGPWISILDIDLLNS
jgi:hypothetical protein